MPVVLPMDLTPSQVRPVAYRVLSKKHGLNIKAGALDVLAHFLGHHFGADWRAGAAERFLDDVARMWKDEDRGLFVDGPPLQQIINDMLNAEAVDGSQAAGAVPAAAENTVFDATAGASAVSGSTWSAGASVAGDAASARRLSTDARARKFQKFHWRDYFKVVNAQQQRRLVYNAATKRFEVPPGGDAAAHTIGAPASLVHLFPTRYHLLFEKLQRSELFQQPLVEGGSSGSGGFGITQIKNMLGRANSEFALFGLLTRPDGVDGELHLADPSGKIPLRFGLGSGKAPGYYYTLGSFVVCTGTYRVDHFAVGTLGPPAVEQRAATQEAYGSLDLYGLVGSARSNRLERVDAALQHTMVREEHALADQHRVVVLGCNIYLDRLPVLDALRRVFAALEAAPAPPLALIIPGSFISAPFQANSTAAYRDAMNALATLLQAAPRLARHTKIVLVPGDNDPWHAAHSKGATPLWPLQPVPAIFSSRVTRAATDVVWASNPARLLYLSQEFVIVRDDYGSRFRRHALSLGGSEILDADAQSAVEAELADERAAAMDLDLPTPPASDAGEEPRSAAGDASAGSVAPRRSRVDDDEAAERKRALASLVADAAAPRAPPNPDGPAAANAAEARRVVATLLDQSHLSPFPLAARPVVWEHDQALSLSQWPSVLVLLDPTTPRVTTTYEGCKVLNPGPFLHDGSASWLEYWPGSGRFEVKALNA